MIDLARFFQWGRTFPKSALVAGVSLLLVGCPDGSVQAPQTIDFGEGDELQIQPIQVCDDNGQNCARVNLFEEFTRKILEQARLKVSFLPTNRINASRLLRIDDNPNRSSPDYEFYEISRTGDRDAFGRHPDSTRETGPINVWFVDEIESSGGFTQFGLAWVNANGVLLDGESISNFGSTGRVDTLAHEISHNLGLRHGDADAQSANNLAADGDIRNVPQSLGEVGTVSQLTNGQISRIKSSGFVSDSGDGNPTEEIESADLVSADAAFTLAQRVAAQSDNRLVHSRIRHKSVAAAHASKSIPEPATGIGIALFGLALLQVKRQIPLNRSQQD